MAEPVAFWSIIFLQNVLDYRALTEGVGGCSMNLVEEKSHFDSARVRAWVTRVILPDFPSAEMLGQRRPTQQ